MGRLSVLIDVVRSIRDQAAGGDEVTFEIDRGQFVPGRQCDDGATCLSSSNHFPLKLNSVTMKPVTLPPGLARLSTTPRPTGSFMTGNTIGTVRVACHSGPTVEMPWARMTSGASATNSAAYR